MARIMIICPSGRGPVPTGYTTADFDLTSGLQTRAFRCACGEIHSWNESAAWAEQGVALAARRRYGLDDPSILGAPPR
jgi:hypothetical protein